LHTPLGISLNLLGKWTDTSDSVTVRVVPAAGVEQGPNPTPEDFEVHLGASNDGLHRFLLDLTAGTTLEEIEQAGTDAVDFGVNFHGLNSVFETLRGTLTGASTTPIVSPASSEYRVEMIDTANVGLDPAVRGAFLALVEVEDVIAQREVYFLETTPSSSVYEGIVYDVSVTVSSLDPTIVDDVVLDVRRSLSTGSESPINAVLSETGIDTKVFASPDFQVDVSGLVLDPAAADAVFALIDLGDEGVHEMRLEETGPDTGVFRSVGANFDLSGSSDPWLDWTEGPWISEPIEEANNSGFGAFSPILFRLKGPYEAFDKLVAAGFTGEVFGVARTLVQFGGAIYFSAAVAEGEGAAADPPPAVLTKTWTPAGTDDGDIFGAGFVKRGEGFVFGQLKDAAGKPAIDSKKVFVGFAEKFLKVLLKDAQQRRDERWNESDIVASYVDVPEAAGMTYPDKRFAQHIWDEFIQPTINENPPQTPMADVLKIALTKMNQPAYKGDAQNAPFGNENIPAGLYRPIVEDLPAPGVDDIVRTTGSHHLIGHWMPTPSGVGHDIDFSCQSQNVTDILHFNFGMGLGEYTTLLFTLAPLLNMPQDTEAHKIDRAVAILQALRDEPQLASLVTADQLTRLRGLLDTAQQNDRLLARATARGAIWFLFQTEFANHAERKHFYVELCKMATMLQAWEGNATRDTLDLALAYDIASGEGFGVFGIDPWNDVISTEAGALMGEALQTGTLNGVPIAITNVDELHGAIQTSYKLAREGLLGHPILSDLSKVRWAFLSSQFRHDGTEYVNPRVKFDAGLGDAGDVYKSTLGQILTIPPNTLAIATEAGRDQFCLASVGNGKSWALN